MDDTLKQATAAIKKFKKKFSKISKSYLDDFNIYMKGISNKANLSMDIIKLRITYTTKLKAPAFEI